MGWYVSDEELARWEEERRLFEHWARSKIDIREWDIRQPTVEDEQLHEHAYSLRLNRRA